MTKKIFKIILLFSLFSITSTFGQINPSFISNKFSNAKGATSVKINRLVCALARPFIEELRDLRIKKINILDLSECDQKIKDNFNNTIRKNFNANKDNVLMYINDDSESLIILTNKKNNRISLLVLGDEPVLIDVKGKVTKDAISKIINYQN